MNKELLNKLNIKIDKIGKKGKAIILGTNYDKYVLKQCFNDKYYEYLKVRDFNYFPDVLDNSSNYLLTRYINDNDVPLNQRLEDMIAIISILHANTSYYKKLDLDTIKGIYEGLINRQDELLKYYLNIQTLIEEEEYMSPADYLLIRNISLIYMSLKKSREYLDKWYQSIKDTKIIRHVYNHGNLDISHFIEGDKPYLISWDNSKLDIPIYDLDDFYRKNFNLIKLDTIFNIYFDKYSLTNEEINLLFTYILIPDKIDIHLKEYDKVIAITNMILYLEDTLMFLKSYSINHNKPINK